MNCQICGHTTSILDVVDFNKSCLEVEKKYLILSGLPIYYRICDGCDFVFSETMLHWSSEKYKIMVYNDDYSLVDPDHAVKRPTEWADTINNNIHRQTHLDYGGGHGLLSSILQGHGWYSKSFDPFYNVSPINETFDLITAIEVFEHCPDVNDMMNNLENFTHDTSNIMFTTLVHEPDIKRNSRLSWWYAAPRNGHVSLFSTKSLEILAEKYRYTYKNVQNAVHLFKRSS